MCSMCIVYFIPERLNLKLNNKFYYHSYKVTQDLTHELPVSVSVNSNQWKMKINENSALLKWKTELK